MLTPLHQGASLAHDAATGTVSRSGAPPRSDSSIYLPVSPPRNQFHEVETPTESECCSPTPRAVSQQPSVAVAAPGPRMGNVLSEHTEDDIHRVVRMLDEQGRRVAPPSLQALKRPVPDVGSATSLDSAGRHSSQTREARRHHDAEHWASPYASGRTQRDTEADVLRDRCAMLSECLQHAISERDALSVMIQTMSKCRDEMTLDHEDMEEEIASLERELKSLKEAKRATDDELHAARERVSQLEQDCELRGALLISHEGRSAELSAQYQSLKEAHGALQSQLDVERAEHRSVELQLAASNSQLEQLERSAELAAVSNRRNEAALLEHEEMIVMKNAAIDSITKQRDSLQADVHRLQPALDAATSAVASLSTSHASLVNDLTVLQQELVAANAEKRIAEEALQQERSHRLQLQEERQQLVLANERVALTADDLHAQLENVKTLYEQLKETCSDAEANKEILIRQHDELESRYARQSQKLEAAELLSAELMSAQKSTVERLDSSLAAQRAAEDEVSVLRSLITVAQAANDRLSADLKCQVENHESTVMSLNRDQLTLVTELQRHEMMKVESESSLVRADLAAEAFEARLRISQSATADVVSILNCIVVRHDLAHERCADLQRTFAESQQDVSRLKPDLVRLQRELEDALDRKRHVEARVDALQSEVHHLREMLEYAKQDREVLSAEMKRSQTLWAAMSEEHAQLRTLLVGYQQPGGGRMSPSRWIARQQRAVSAEAAPLEEEEPSHFHEQNERHLHPVVLTFEEEDKSTQPPSLSSPPVHSPARA